MPGPGVDGNDTRRRTPSDLQPLEYDGSERTGLMESSMAFVRRRRFRVSRYRIVDSSISAFTLCGSARIRIHAYAFFLRTRRSLFLVSTRTEWPFQGYFPRVSGVPDPVPRAQKAN